MIVTGYFPWAGLDDSEIVHDSKLAKFMWNIQNFTWEIIKMHIEDWFSCNTFSFAEGEALFIYKNKVYLLTQKPTFTRIRRGSAEPHWCCRSCTQYCGKKWEHLRPDLRCVLSDGVSVVMAGGVMYCARMLRTATLPSPHTTDRWWCSSDVLSQCWPALVNVDARLSIASSPTSLCCCQR